MVIQAGALIDVANFRTIGPTGLAGLLESGFTASTLDVTRIGETVFWEGAITPSTNWGAANALNTPLAVGDIPAEFVPDATIIFIQPSMTGTATTIFRVAVQPTGELQVRCNTATFTGAVHLSMTYRGASL